MIRVRNDLPKFLLHNSLYVFFSFLFSAIILNQIQGPEYEEKFNAIFNSDIQICRQLRLGWIKNECFQQYYKKEVEFCRFSDSAKTVQACKEEAKKILREVEEQSYDRALFLVFAFSLIIGFFAAMKLLVEFASYNLDKMVDKIDDLFSGGKKKRPFEYSSLMKKCFFLVVVAVFIMLITYNIIIMG